MQGVKITDTITRIGRGDVSKAATGQAIVAKKKTVNTLFSDFFTSVQSEVNILAEAPGGVGDWALQEKIQLDRGTFSFKKHEFMELPYSDVHPFQVEKKAAQLGNTTRAFLRMFYCGLFMPFVGLMYLFPSKTGSGDFSRSRVAPFIEANPDSIGKFIQDTDSVGLKRIRGKNFIFRGTKSTEGLRSDPVDFIMYDEFDLFPKGIEAVARERMGHSEYKWEHYLSNPTIPDFGIDKLFQQTDQRHWLLRCPKCGKFTCLEDSVTDDDIGCIAEYSDGRVELLCSHCRDSALNPADGVWVAKKPSVTEYRGYQYSQLFSQYVTPGEILHAFRTSTNRAAVWNYKLGLAYIEAENRLSMEEILKLCGTAGNAATDSGPCYMGVDQGEGLHVTIGKLHPDRLVHIGEYKNWEDLDRLVDNFGVLRCVCDAMPERRNARAFADRHPGIVYVNYYNDHAHDGAAWNEAKGQVSSNRTESLDASQKMIADGLVGLPREGDAVRDFALHCHNVAKKLEEKEDGSKRYTYVKLGPDHYRHSWNYAVLARAAMIGSCFGESDLS